MTRLWPETLTLFLPHQCCLTCSESPEIYDFFQVFSISLFFDFHLLSRHMFRRQLVVSSAPHGLSNQGGCRSRVLDRTAVKHWGTSLIAFHTWPEIFIPERCGNCKLFSIHLLTLRLKTVDWFLVNTVAVMETWSLFQFIRFSSLCNAGMSTYKSAFPWLGSWPFTHIC